jgi:hypothetical protein
MRSELNKLSNSIRNKEELSDQWKDAIVVPVDKKSDKTDCSNRGGISLISTPYNNLFDTMLSMLSPYIGDITGDHRCGFRRNSSATDQISFYSSGTGGDGITMRQHVSHL